MPVIDAMAGSRAIKAFNETWGHLRPKSGTDHPGTMVASSSDYNNQGVTVIHARFATLHDSPWFYEAMNDYVFEHLTRRSSKGVYVDQPYTDTDGTPKVYRSLVYPRLRSCGVWEFRGVCRVYKNDRIRFLGKWTKMDLYPGRIPATQPRGHWGVWPYSGEKADPRMRESNDDYYRRNWSSVVRFLDTMNNRRHGRDGMEPRSKTDG